MRTRFAALIVAVASESVASPVGGRVLAESAMAMGSGGEPIAALDLELLDSLGEAVFPDGDAAATAGAANSGMASKEEEDEEEDEGADLEMDGMPAHPLCTPKKVKSELDDECASVSATRSAGDRTIGEVVWGPQSLVWGGGIVWPPLLCSLPRLCLGASFILTG